MAASVGSAGSGAAAGDGADAGVTVAASAGAAATAGVSGAWVAGPLETAATAGCSEIAPSTGGSPLASAPCAAAAFAEIAGVPDESPLLHIEQRELKALRRAGGVVWFDFHMLCGGPRSQNDYLELANRFHTVVLSDVPKMTPRMASEARRFTWLVDVFYDHKVKLLISAEVAPEELYVEGTLANEFARTVSRLVEMQSLEYLEAPRRVVDTSLT